MNSARKLVVALAALGWPSAGVAQQVASASAQASGLVGRMGAAALVACTLALVLLGYFLMAGHGSRLTFAHWAAGFIVIAAAPAFVAIFN